MALASTDSQIYQDIAQAIADVKGESVSLTPAQMAAEVAQFYYEPPSWANATWEEIAALLDLHYAGAIDISDYWNVGDYRTVSLTAMAATGVGESHVAQDVELVVADFNKIPLTSSQKTALGTSKTTAAVVFTQRHMLANGTEREGGYMNSSDTNSGGWNACARRTWCNNVYKAALPSNLQGLLKQVDIVTANGSGSSTETSADYIFLPAEKEIFGSVTNANSTAESLLSQWQWFATSDNRIKKAGASGSALSWWERSPGSGNSGLFCRVNSDGTAGVDIASSGIGLAPSGCI